MNVPNFGKYTVMTRAIDSIGNPTTKVSRSIIIKTASRDPPTSLQRYCHSFLISFFVLYEANVKSVKPSKKKKKVPKLRQDGQTKQSGGHNKRKAGHPVTPTRYGKGSGKECRFVVCRNPVQFQMLNV